MGGGGLGPGVICGRELLCAIMTRMVFFFYIIMKRELCARVFLPVALLMDAE